MKRFQVLGLAAAFVFGMSALAGAAAQILDTDSIPVNVKVAKYAEFSWLPRPTSQPMTLNFQQPKDMTYEGMISSDVSKFSLKTNTNVTISMYETVSSNVAAALAAHGYENSANLVWGGDGDLGNDGDWVVGFEPWLNNGWDASNVGANLGANWIQPDTWSRKLDANNNFVGVETTFSSAKSGLVAGNNHTDLGVTLHGTWRNVNTENGKVDWWKLLAADYSGEIFVTVAAE